MPLPDEFSPWHHLLEMLLSTHNRRVEQTFIGVPHNDLETAMGGMRVACFITEDDTVDMIVLRMMLFYFVFEGHLPQPIYGIPVASYDVSFKYKPQVHLYFKEDHSAFLMETKLPPATAEIGFRLMHETSATMNEGKARSIAARINEFFALEGGFTFQKGHLIVSYRDKDRGIETKLFVENEGEAIRVVERVLEVMQVPFDEHRVTVHQSKQSFSQMPPEKEIYGKLRRGARKRPITRVRFYRAELFIEELGQAIILVDRLRPQKDLIGVRL
jgi:hypothetical protein